MAGALWVLKTSYSLVLEVENFSALVVSTVFNTAPATMAMRTAAMLPIQNDFIIWFLPENGSAYFESAELKSF